jgi:hypothetical protein
MFPVSLNNEDLFKIAVVQKTYCNDKINCIDDSECSLCSSSVCPSGPCVDACVKAISFEGIDDISCSGVELDNFININVIPQANELKNINNDVDFYSIFFDTNTTTNVSGNPSEIMCAFSSESDCLNPDKYFYSGNDSDLDNIFNSVINSVFNNGGVRDYTANLSKVFGIKIYESDLHHNYGAPRNILIRAWIPKEKLTELKESGLILNLKTGKHAASYVRGIEAFKMPIYLSLKIPAGYDPNHFVKSVLSRLNNYAGFSLIETIDVRRISATDANKKDYYTVKLVGRISLDSLSNAASYPFVTGIDTAPIEYASL